MPVGCRRVGVSAQQKYWAQKEAEGRCVVKWFVVKISDADKDTGRVKYVYCMRVLAGLRCSIAWADSSKMRDARGSCKVCYCSRRQWIAKLLVMRSKIPKFQIPTVRSSWGKWRPRDRFPLARLVYSGVLQGTEGKELPKRQAQTVKRLWWLAVCGVLFPNLRKICPGGRVHGAVLDAVIQAGTIKRIS